MLVSRIEGGSELGRPVMQWTLANRGPRDEQVHIQVGELATGYYVHHTGFGRRPFPDKRAAWGAVRELMRRHRGIWREVQCDDAPFRTLYPPDGSRVLFDTDDNCLFGHWGELKDKWWDRYLAALDAGQTFRRTETHALFEGYIKAITYTEPETGVERHAVVTAVDADSGYRVIDYPDRDVANAAYEKEVRDNRNDEFPYRSSD